MFLSEGESKPLQPGWNAGEVKLVQSRKQSKSLKNRKAFHMPVLVNTRGAQRCIAANGQPYNLT